MATQYPSSFKNCATCEYWGGERTFSDPLFCKNVEVSSPMEKGRCYCKNSGWFSSPGKQANFSCLSYERWSAINK